MDVFCKHCVMNKQKISLKLKTNFYFFEIKLFYQESFAVCKNRLYTSI